jgi:hypothetical protein
MRNETVTATFLEIDLAPGGRREGMGKMKKVLLFQRMLSFSNLKQTE